MYKVTKENVVGIGKLKLYPTKVRPGEIPVLHYLVIRESDGLYSAICIELRLESSGSTVQETREKLTEAMNAFVDKTFSLAPSIEEAYGSLISLTVLDDDSENEWNIYRYCQLCLAMRGKRTDIVMELENEIKTLKKRIVELESAQKMYTMEQEQSFNDEFMEIKAA